MQYSPVERVVKQPRFKSQPYLSMAVWTWGNIIRNFTVCGMGNTTTFLTGSLGRLLGNEGALLLDLHPRQKWHTGSSVLQSVQSAVVGTEQTQKRKLQMGSKQKEERCYFSGVTWCRECFHRGSHQSSLQGRLLHGRTKVWYATF